MKKYIIPVIFSIAIGVYLGMMLLKQYNNAQALTPVFNNGLTEIYFIKEGEYTSLEDMEKSMIKFPYYIHTNKDGIYHTYLCISTQEENAQKIKGYYDNLEYRK